MSNDHSGSTNQKGIDLKQALEILSARSAQPDSEHHNHSEGCCHSQEAPPNAKSMGQTIDMLREAGSEEVVKSAEEAEALQKKVQEDRDQRKSELDKRIQSMTVKELLQCVLESQQQRVRAYGTYNGGLETVMQTGNMTNYPSLCAEATASFSVLSDTIRSAQNALETRHKRKDAAVLIAQLQSKEKQKLNFTAALHLEKIRERNQTEPGAEPDRIAMLLREGVVSLQNQINTCIEGINEVLDELRCILLEEED